MGTNSNRGKFSEKLKNILRFKRRKTKDSNDNLLVDDSNKMYMNFIKVIAAIPGLVYGNITDKDNDKIIKNEHINENKNNISSNDRLNDTFNINNRNENNNYLNTTYKDNIDNNNIDIKNNNIKKIENINIDKIRNNQEKFFNNKNYQNNNKGLNSIYNNNPLDIQKNRDNITSNLHVNKIVKDDKKVKELEKNIINMIKKKLIKTVNEMEILQSELYILSEINGESKVLNECRQELDQIKNILCKIDKLKEQYDFLRDNYDFEYLLEIDDNILIDKIIELKDTFSNNEIRAVAEDYKLLDVYKYLYLKIDDLQEKTIIFEEKKKEEELKLKDRDVDFENLKNNVYNIDYINRNYDSFVKEQNILLKKIDENIDKINSYEEINYHLKGFNQLFRNSFKYFGLLMVSPLKGIIPSIATETLLTGNLIKNLYKNLKWEESKRMVYETMDYSSMIGNAINDLEGTSIIVDTTLDDIIHLKMEYNDRFKKYQGDFLEYREVMQKITDMENKILGNKIKIEMMRKRALEQQKINDKKLTLVKNLNDKQLNNN